MKPLSSMKPWLNLNELQAQQCCSTVASFTEKRAAGEKLDNGGYSGSTYPILSQI